MNNYADNHCTTNKADGLDYHNIFESQSGWSLAQFTQQLNIMLVILSPKGSHHLIYQVDQAVELETPSAGVATNGFVEVIPKPEGNQNETTQL